MLRRRADHQGGRCFFCTVTLLFPDGANLAAVERPANMGRAAYAAWKAARRATLDHVVPRSLGGSDAEENFVAACQWCNWYRGATALADAQEDIARMLASGRHPHQRVLATGVFPRLARRRG